MFSGSKSLSSWRMEALSLRTSTRSTASSADVDTGCLSLEPTTAWMSTSLFSRWDPSQARKSKRRWLQLYRQMKKKETFCRLEMLVFSTRRWRKRDLESSIYQFVALTRSQRTTSITVLIKMDSTLSSAHPKPITIPMKSFPAAFTLETGIMLVTLKLSKLLELRTSWTSLTHVRTTWQIHTLTSTIFIWTFTTRGRQIWLIRSTKSSLLSRRRRYRMLMTAPCTWTHLMLTSASARVLVRGTMMMEATNQMLTASESCLSPTKS